MKLSLPDPKPTPEAITAARKAQEAQARQQKAWLQEHCEKWDWRISRLSADEEKIAETHGWLLFIGTKTGDWAFRLSLLVQLERRPGGPLRIILASHVAEVTGADLQCLAKDILSGQTRVLLQKPEPGKADDQASQMSAILSDDPSALREVSKITVLPHSEYELITPNPLFS